MVELFVVMSSKSAAISLDLLLFVSFSKARAEFLGPISGHQKANDDILSIRLDAD